MTLGKVAWPSPLSLPLLLHPHLSEEQGTGCNFSDQGRKENKPEGHGKCLPSMGTSQKSANSQAASDRNKPVHGELLHACHNFMHVIIAADSPGSLKNKESRSSQSHCKAST